MNDKKELNIPEIREYNRELKEYTRKFSDMRAKMDLNTKEVNRLCAELTTELGIQVTPANLEQVYAECVEKINNQLAVGKEILGRIKTEEQQNQMSSVAENTVNNTEGFTIPAGATPMGGMMPQMFGFNQNQGQQPTVARPFGEGII